MLALSIGSPQAQTSRSNLIAAFRRVVASTGRRQATDLHVRRLLCYIRAKDVDGQGAQRSLKQIANRLVLSVSTCRRVIRRAVKRFGLLIVISQRNTPRGQSANRYSINWHHVDTILGMTAVSSSAVQFARPARTRARSKRIPPASESTSLGNTDMPVRLGPTGRTCLEPSLTSNNTPALSARTRTRSKRILPTLISPRNMPVVLRPRTACLHRSPAGPYHLPVRLGPRPARTRACSKRFLPENSSPGNTDVLVGSSDRSESRADLISRRSMPVRLAPPVLTDQADNTFTSAARTRARSERIHSSESLATLISRTDLAPHALYDRALDNTTCPSGSTTPSGAAPIRMSCYDPTPPVRIDHPPDHTICPSGTDLALREHRKRMPSTLIYARRVTTSHPPVPCDQARITPLARSRVRLRSRKH